MKKILGILLVSGLIAPLVNLVHPNRIPWVQDWNNYVESKAKDADIEIIPLSVAHSHLQAGTHLYVDARSSAEYNEKHIPTALSLPFEDLHENFHVLEQVMASDRPVIVYCTNRECDDALLLAIELRDMGRSNLVYYVDGFELWEESGCPVEAQ